MSAQLYQKCGDTLRVQGRSVVGTPVDFYVSIAGQFSGWIRGAPQLYHRLAGAFHARNRVGFDDLADQLMKEYPNGS